MKRALVSSLILFGLSGLSSAGVWDLEQTPATATFYGAYNDDHLGTGMAVGDVNGDGQLDLLLSASGWDHDSTTQYHWGIAYLFYGGSLLGAKDLRQDSADFTVVGYPDGAWLGVSAVIGDVNGDGKEDLIIGTAVARGESLPGVVVFFGRDLHGTIELPGTPPDYAIYPPGLGFDVGSGLTVGDVNGDGITDIIMPAPFSHGPNNRDDCGAVYIVYGSRSLSGRRDLAVDSADVTIYGADAHDELGFRGGQDPPVSVGDVNGDGIGDLVVTAFGADGPGNSRGEMTGEAYVFYGGNLPRAWDLNVRPADLIVYGKRGGSSLDVGVIGDVNGDGYGDVFLGSEGEAGTGEAYLLYGGNPPPRGVKDLAVDSVDYTIVGIDTNDCMAANIALADVNADGKKDLVIGAPVARGPNNTRWVGSGEVYLIFGSNLRGRRTLRTSPPDWTFYGLDRESYLLGVYLRCGNVTGGRNDELIMDSGHDVSGPPGEIRYGAGDVHVFDLQPLIGAEAPEKSERANSRGIRPKPNPFTSFAVIPGREREHFVIYDISGRVVGNYKGDRIGEGLVPGVYFIRLEGGDAKPLRVVKVR